MPEQRKVLGQLSPSAASLQSLYTVPGGTTQAVVSTIQVCHCGATAANFRLSVAVAGAADDPSQYIYYDLPLMPNDVFSMTTGFTLGPTDELRCYSDVGDVSFSAFGVEIT